MKPLLPVVFCFLQLPLFSSGQSVPPSDVYKKTRAADPSLQTAAAAPGPGDRTQGEANWNAQWIAAADDDGRGYGVYYFRKDISLDTRPASFPVYVTADNRYKLFVNGRQVSLGPARGDLTHWNYETVDLAASLVAGKNNITAVVWNEANSVPEAQISFRTGFILQGATVKEQQLNSNKSWKCIRDKGHLPIPGFFFAASTGQLVDMNQSVMKWWDPATDDSKWPQANAILDGKRKGTSDGFGWMLVPSAIPAMEMVEQRINRVRIASGITVPEGFPLHRQPLTIPANSSVTLLLDQDYLTNAYLTISFSKGTGAGLSLGYAESLYDKNREGGMKKGNRNEVEGKDFVGRTDSLLSNGKDGQSFTTLNYRTYRYIRLYVRTAAEPLVIDDLYGTFTGFPFRPAAKFEGAGDSLQEILDIGWRTARLNATETYMDCPYYEQLQYIGDTRIQALVSYFYAGDDRLARNALTLMDHSRLPEGVTYSRYPTRSAQVISTFSLWYIGMLHDYWMYRPDAGFVKDKLIGARSVLDFFSRYQSDDGSLRHTPYWTFVDWAGGKDWFVGSPPRSAEGRSSIIDLQLLMAYQWMAEMEGKMGMPANAALYKGKADQLAQTIRKRYWNAEKKMFADTDDKTHFSQHANSLAILTGLIRGQEAKQLAGQMLSDKSLTACTIYFKYYLHQALVKAGLGNDYLTWLDVWRENIRSGLTTWAEEPNVNTSRSDCHAWGSSPNIELFRTVLGIESAAPGFASVLIEPKLGLLKEAKGEISHPNGTLSVDYKLLSAQLHATVTLPPGTTGTLLWRGKKTILRPGINKLVI
ncbi:MAG: alpha-rhamnosidase [Chitinophagaceae bacterium]|nr:MAG: alpha-rhamnosidase [Chitinophagaceae bacterium]